MDKVGYTLATYSSMFNGVALPERDQLLDLVGYLHGEPREWSRRLASTIAAEEKWNHSIDARDDSAAELEILKVEVEGYRVIANDPDSVFAQVKRMREDVEKRINFSRELELNLNAAISTVSNHLHEAQKDVPMAQAEAQVIVDRARAAAQGIEYSARVEAQTQLEKAEGRVKELVARAEVEASEIIDKAGVESRRIRADAGRIVDQLLLEGDQYLEQARVDRLQGELEKQRGEALVERMKLRAKIDLAQVIMQAQNALADAGASEYSDMLDVLLQDLGINEIPSDSEDLKGRHRKVASSSSSPRRAPLVESVESASISMGEESESKTPLPRRRKPQR
ncbi:hypothetical protein PV729_38225 [Streptomyces europaeiscabiei]|uniref:Uncharacterized protein n=1 Tax=Streptomyces europaeiscabiei TaxID=146819 RepID=A0ABU4NLB6_9ACTN|nr:hypothetical protein [Streptomyces europaeiscabiei]MDX3546199.1 hypothetical protein [Streptomyces europaeiscabiei]MDX3557495.1 hypothetical protein [Streptomyces europaeiscabiei]MDX3703598.1 hypothetical protein [Streptomyces europaeiscabiei]